MKLLVISNGHGEDIIALKIIHQLQRLLPSWEFAGLPMVGEGFAYRNNGITIITDVKTMPSGGFIYMDNQQLWRDIRHGLLGLTLKQYQSVKAWGKSGGIILAVGDILPLLLAWLSGANYFFVGTAKSEYYLRDEHDWLANISWLERYWGSYYYPWEHWLMRQSRCLGVFPRDTITTLSLQKANIPAYDLGNPMMDDLSITKQIIPDTHPYSLRVLLLPGSRMPEAIDNWQLILQGVNSIINTYINEFVCIAAIAPSLSLKDFEKYLFNDGWKSQQIVESWKAIINDSNIMYFNKEQATVILSQNAYSQSLNYCNISLAMAGTATEQFIGLGKPAIAFPGKGPQYNLQFANNQKRLLGISLQLVNHPHEVGEKIQQLLANPPIWQEIAANGKKRLGEIGASLRIAQFIQKTVQNLSTKLEE